MKRLVAAVVMGIMVGAPASALAQAAPTARVTSPASGQAITGIVTARGEGHAAAGVRKLQLFVAGAAVAAKEPSDVRQKVEVDYSWDTSGLNNGVYPVRVVVSATGGGEADHTINVKVDNAPSAPSGLSKSVDGQTVSLSWSANPEPDLLGYRVETSTGAEWTVVAETSDTTYRAEVSPGDHAYRITAVRSSPTMEGGRPSQPSEPIAVTVEAPASSGGSGGPSGDGGGRGKADRRLFGSDGKGTRGDVLETARRFAGTGLSFGGISLPGQMGAPSLPGTEALEWGTYKEKLPYSIPAGGVSLESAPPRLAAVSTTRVIPVDALRWVAVGALMIAIAGMLQFLAWRSESSEKLAAVGGLPELKLFPALDLDAAKELGKKIGTIDPQATKALAKRLQSRTAVSFGDAIVRVRRVQDRVRTAWEKTRSR